VPKLRRGAFGAKITSTLKDENKTNITTTTTTTTTTIKQAPDVGGLWRQNYVDSGIQVCMCVSE
jgi:hypothetical protein